MPQQPPSELAEFSKTMISFVSGLALGIITEPVRRWLFRSRLKASFSGKDEGHCIRDTPVNSEGKSLGRATFIRVKVEASRFTARGCRAFLTKIEAQENDRFVTVFSDTLPLPWSYDSPKAIEIPKDVSFFYDVFSVGMGYYRLVPATGRQPLLFNEMLR